MKIGVHKVMIWKPVVITIKISINANLDIYAIKVLLEIKFKTMENLLDQLYFNSVFSNDYDSPGDIMLEGEDYFCTLSSEEVIDKSSASYYDEYKDNGWSYVIDTKKISPRERWNYGDDAKLEMISAAWDKLDKWWIDEDGNIFNQNKQVI